MVCQSGFCIFGVVTALENHIAIMSENRSTAPSLYKRLSPAPWNKAWSWNCCYCIRTVLPSVRSAAESRAFAQSRTGVAVLQVRAGFLRGWFDLSDELCDTTMYTVNFRVNVDQLPLLNVLNVYCL